MRAFALLLFFALPALAQTEKWTYNVPGLNEMTPTAIDIRVLRHDKAGNVALVIRYTVEEGILEQVRWLAANGQEIGAANPHGTNAKIISVSDLILLLSFTDGDTGMTVLQRLRRKDTNSKVVKRDVVLGAGDKVFTPAENVDSPTSATFFVEKRTSPTAVAISRYTVK